MKLTWAAIRSKMQEAFQVPTEGDGYGWGAWVVDGTGAGVVVVFGGSVVVVVEVVVVVVVDVELELVGLTVEVDVDVLEVVDSSKGASGVPNWASFKLITFWDRTERR